MTVMPVLITKGAFTEEAFLIIIYYTFLKSRKPHFKTELLMLVICIELDETKRFSMCFFYKDNRENSECEI